MDSVSIVNFRGSGAKFECALPRTSTSGKSFNRIPAADSRDTEEKKGGCKVRGGKIGGRGGALRGARKAICETSLRFLVSTRRRLIGASNEFLRRVSVEIPEEEKEEEREEGERQRKRRESL